MTNSKNINDVYFLINSPETFGLNADIEGLSYEEIEDNYRFYLNRDVDLQIVHAEREVDELPELINQTRIAMMEAEVEYKCNHSSQNWDNLYNMLQELWKLEFQLKRAGEFLEDSDFNIRTAEQAADYDIDNISRDDCPNLGQSIFDYVAYYGNKLSADELHTIWQTLVLMKEDNEISWNHYTGIGIGVLRRLANKVADRKWEADFWMSECKKLQKNRARFRAPKGPSFDEAFHGSMEIDMESSIDTMRYIRKLSDRTGLSIEECFSMIND